MSARPEDVAVPSYTDIRAAIIRALSNVGKRNGHACPSTQSHDVVSHDMMVAEEGYKFFSRARKQAQDNVRAVIKATDVSVQPGETREVVAGSIYGVTLQVKNPSMRTDLTAFANELRKLGVDADVIERAKHNATKPTKPAEVFAVISR